MHRAVCRFIRGTCSKYGTREPTIATEEVHKKRQEKNEDFIPKYNFADALGLGTGIFLTYDFIHNRHKYICPFSSRRTRQLRNEVEDDAQNETTSTTTISTASTAPKTKIRYEFDFFKNTCLFTLFGGLKALGQPQLSTATYVKTQQRQYHQHHQLQKKKSIDRTPFLKESFLSLDEQEKNDNFSSTNTSITSYSYEGSAGSTSSSSFGHDFEDDIIFLKEDTTLAYKDRPFLPTTKITDPATLHKAEQFTGNLLSLLGAFKFLSYPNNDSNNVAVATATNPPNHALDILKMGCEFGSSRALYNMGVAYDRLNDQVLARDYYKKAADLGHPLATFNIGIFKLRDGQVNEAVKLLQYAAKHDVVEAKSILEEIAK